MQKSWKQYRLATISAFCLFTAFLSATPVLKFSGTLDTISLSESLVFPADTPFTIEYWLCSTNSTGIGSGNEYSVIRSSDGNNYSIMHFPYHYVSKAKSSFATANSGFVFGSPHTDIYFEKNLEDSDWKHIAITRDAENVLQVFVDGNLISNGTWNHGIGLWDGELRFNRIGNGLLGSVADVRVWDYERSGEEIEFDRYRRLAGNEEGLLGYWPLDDGTGNTTVLDLSPAGNDGTISGALWQADPALVLVADDSAFAPSSPIVVADKVTGSEKFTNSDEVQVVAFPVPPAVDQFQVTFSPDPDSLDQDPSAWTSTALSPQELTFAQPANDSDMVLYVWFRDELSPESLRRASAQIRYSTAAPVATAHSSLARETAGYTLRLLPAELDNGSNGGTSDGTDIPIYKMEVISVSNPAVDLTPGEVFGTLPATVGDYSFALRVINAAGNETISAPCTVSLAQTNSLPTGDHYVAIGNLNAASPFATWATAAAEIQAAVNVAADNARVLVARGIYQGSGAQIVNITRPLQLVGIHPREEIILDGGGGAFGNRRGIVVTMPTAGATAPEVLIANFTVINGFEQSSSGNRGSGIGLVYTSASTGTATVRNCVISNNYSIKSSSDGYRAAGAGLAAVGAADSQFHVYITGCLFENNHGYSRAGYGGALYADYGRLTVEQSDFIGNESHGLRWQLPTDQYPGRTYYIYTGSGGAACIRNIAPDSVVRGCTFEANRSLSGGGGDYTGALQVQVNPITVENSIFKYNHSGYFAAARFDTAGKTNLVRNCLVYGNRANSWGGGLMVYTGSYLEIENSTITGNTCANVTGGGGGVTAYYTPSGIEVFNSIIYGNEPNNFYPATRVLFDHSCTSPDATGEGNINQNPVFVDAPGGNYRLSAASPCRNSGKTMDWMEGARDLDGKRRVDIGSGVVDMGCYEYQSSASIILLR